MDSTTPFYGHPPLAFGLQAIFYKSFGDSIFIDKLYSVCTVCITAFLIFLIWKVLNKKSATAWLPLLLWLCFPLVQWALTNNSLENSMSMFVLASLYFYLFYKKRKQWYGFVISGFMLCLAFFTKGFTGLFPLAMPLIYGIMFKEKFGHIIKEAAWVLSGLLVPCLILFLLNNEAYTYMIKYMQVQVFSSLENEHWVNVDTRWFIVLRFLKVSIPHLAILLLLCLYHWKSKQNTLFQSYQKHRKIFWVLILCGLCGVFPIMLSLKQSGFYMLSALPLFALALALLFEESIQALIQRIALKTQFILLIVSILFIGLDIGSIIWHAGTYSHDRQFLTDMHQLLQYLPKYEIISIDPSMSEDWKLYPYFARYKNISLDPKNERTFLLLRDTSTVKNFENPYVLVCQTQTLLLYKVVDKHKSYISNKHNSILF